MYINTKTNSHLTETNSPALRALRLPQRECVAGAGAPGGRPWSVYAVTVSRPLCQARAGRRGQAGAGRQARRAALVSLCRDCVTALVPGEGQARAAGAGRRAQAGRYGWGAGGRVPAQMARAMSLRAWHLSWVMARLRL